jgi:hypothetical protein
MDGLERTNGSDHVSSATIAIQWPRSLDRENERPSRGHVTETDGCDFHCLVGPGFTLECYF